MVVRCVNQGKDLRKTCETSLMENKDAFAKLIDSNNIEDLISGNWSEDVLQSDTICNGCDYPKDFQSGQPALHAACLSPPSERNQKIIEWLLTKHSPIKYVFLPLQYSVVHAAAISGNLPAVQLVLDSLPTIEGKKELLQMCSNLQEVTALQLACASGNLNMVNYLFETALTLEVDLVKNDNNRLPFYVIEYAPYSADDAPYQWLEREMILDVLINKYNVSLECTNEAKQGIFHRLAARSSRSVDSLMWDYLLKMIGDSTKLLRLKDTDGNTPLHIACRCSQRSSIDYLLSVPACRADLFLPNQQGLHPYHLLFEQRSTPAGEGSGLTILSLMGCEVVCTLIDVNATVMERGETVLHAAIRGHWSHHIIKLLLDGGADWHTPARPHTLLQHDLHDEKKEQNGSWTPLQAMIALNPTLAVRVFQDQQDMIIRQKTQLRHAFRSHPISIPSLFPPNARPPPPPPPPIKHVTSASAGASATITKSHQVQPMAFLPTFLELDGATPAPRHVDSPPNSPRKSFTSTPLVSTNDSLSLFEHHSY